MTTQQWWKSKSLVTMMIAAIASVPPITVGLSTYITAKSELTLLREKQLHEIQLSYLDRALDPDKSAEYRLGVLKFLSSSLTDQGLKDWAKHTQHDVSQNVAAIKMIESRLEKLELLEKRANKQSKTISQGKAEFRELAQEEMFEIISEITEAQDRANELLNEKYEIRNHDVSLSNALKFPKSWKMGTFAFIPPIENIQNVMVESDISGVNFLTALGSEIHAIANGKIVYTGDGLNGYGNLLILKHNKNFLSAYAHIHEFLVKEQELVKAGDIIALSGDTGSEQPMLRLEIRFKGKAVTGEGLKALVLQ